MFNDQFQCLVLLSGKIRRYLLLFAAEKASVAG